MPRPKQIRHILSRPLVDSFGPIGVEGGRQVILSHEEYEAIRLIDYGGMDQAGAAQIMKVSRHTVGRILRQARLKMAGVLVEGHRLRVEGGCYRIGARGERRQRKGCGRGRGKGRGASRFSGVEK